MADAPQRLSRYRRDRRNFSLKVYIIAFVWSLVTVLGWLLFFFVDNPMDKHFWVPLVFLFCAFLLLTVFVFWERMRFWIPFNWIVAVLIMVCVCLGLAIAVRVSDKIDFAIVVVITAVIVILVLVVGTYLPHDLTLDIVILMVLSMIFLVSIVFFVMLHVLAGVKYSLFFYILFVGITVIIFLMYHAQTINGHRYAEMRLSDYILAALTVYHDYIILFIVMVYVYNYIKGTEFQEGGVVHKSGNQTRDASIGVDYADEPQSEEFLVL